MTANENPVQNTRMEETLMKHMTMVFLLLVGGGLMAQANPGQTENNKQEQVTAQGCLTRSSGDYVLTESDPGNSYVLHSGHDVKLGHYLGQQVKVIGTKSETLSDSSDTGRSAPPATITVRSITTISRECRP
jgi:hypothetical protein